MKFTLSRKLFWFIKDKAEIDLNNPSALDMYLQQVLSRGRADDVKKLLKTIDLSSFKAAFNRSSGFLPDEVKRFWEDYIGHTDIPAKRNP